MCAIGLQLQRPPSAGERLAEQRGIGFSAEVIALQMSKAECRVDQGALAAERQSVFQQVNRACSAIGSEAPDLMPRAEIALVRLDVLDRPGAEAALLVRRQNDLKRT